MLFGIVLAAATIAACGQSTGALHKIQVHTPLSCPCPTIAPLAQYSIPGEAQCCSQTGAYFGSMTVGPDGNIWIPEFDANLIARATVAGTITEFPVPTAGAEPYMITSGPDGNLWFTEGPLQAQAIARVTTAGAITEFPLPPPLNNAVNPQADGVQAIAPGPDGNLWFAHAGANVIGVMNTSGQVLKTYPIPTADSDVTFIIAGPDGNMWFTEEIGNNIGRLTVSTGHIDEFSVPTAASHPKNLIIGPDNNIWFPEIEAGKVAKVTMSGAITEFLMVSDPTIHRIRRIAVTSDGSMWVVNAMVAPPWDSEIGKFDTTGTELDLWSVGGEPRAIIGGPDGNPWFADEAKELLVRL